jgi:DNA polymerase-3 subunit delta
MAKQQELSCDDILKQLKEKKYAPVYLLMGEEAYYIDLISNYIIDNVLTDTEKEFNQMVFYGADVEAATVINAAKRYPMMADKQVVIVKEAQNMEKIEDLEYYLMKPLESTILVLCYKHGVVDRRKKFVSQIANVGVLFESKAIKETQLPAFVASYLKRCGVDIEPKASAMMAEFVGTDISRMVSELDKLIITLPAGSKRIVPEQVEKNIGVSKEYNCFELKSAIIERDVLKANKIINYFEANPKANPIQKTLAFLFSFFSNLMMSYYAPDKSEQGVAAWLGFRSSWAARDYVTAMHRYSGMKTMNIIGEIRLADARSKGIDGGGMTDGDIMRELIFKILH